MHSKDDHTNAGILLREMMQDVKPAAVGHRDIEQHDVGFEIVDQFDCFTALAGFADDSHAFDLFNKRSNPRANERVVIGYEYAD